MIFQGITWGQYSWGVGTLVLLYYTFVLLRYYPGELKKAWRRQSGSEAPKSPLVTELASPLFPHSAPSLMGPSHLAMGIGEEPIHSSHTPANTPTHITLDPPFETHSVIEREKGPNEDSGVEESVQASEIIAFASSPMQQHRQEDGIPASMLLKYKDVVDQGVEVEHLAETDKEDYWKAVAFTEALESYTHNLNRISSISRSLFAQVNPEAENEETLPERPSSPIRNDFSFADLNSLLETDA